MVISKMFLLLEDCRMREKLLRTSQYGLQLLSPLISSRREAIIKLSSNISLTRIILRFFDDYSTLCSSISYGFGKQNEGIFVRALTVIENIAGQLYLPIEHFAFAYDAGLLTGSSEKAWKYCIILWAATLLTSILKLLLRKSDILIQMSELKNKNNLKLIRRKFEAESWSLIMYSSDLVVALHFLSLLPHGKQLSTWKVGLFGTISSIIGLIRLLNSYS